MEGVRLCLVFLCVQFLLEGEATKSLYDSNDLVTEITIENEAILASPDKIYVVEFYAHWCGHCIRYSPFWKSVASIFQIWKESVVIAAMNCAELDCSAYEIPGTPTIKVFRPFNNTSGGVEISTNKRLVLHDIYDFIKEASMKDEEHPEKYPDLWPFRGESLQEIEGNVVSQKSVLLFKELPELDWSELIIITFSHGSPNSFKIIDTKASNLDQKLGVTSRPAVAIVNWMDRSQDKVFIVDLSSYSSTLDQVAVFLNKNLFSEVVNSEESHIDLGLSSQNHSDIVYESDLEKTIKYMLTVEIPTYSLEDNSRFNSLKDFLETLLRYLPLREEILSTILELRNWLEEQETIDEEDYKAQLKLLIAKYKPFKSTPSEWKGCKGSTPYFRGYPCGVWTLFHVLTVQSAVVEESMGRPSGGTDNRVIMAIMEYIKHFFSCRNCAENFIKKVNSIGHLPSTSYDAVLWLWRIHNMANHKLKGDSTEDPEHQKIIWPNPTNCPECRSPEGDLLALEERWSKAQLFSYILNVYRDDSIKKSLESPSSYDLEDKLVDAILSGNFTDRDAIKERLRQHCFQLG